MGDYKSKKVSKDPVLHIHKYVVVIYGKKTVQYRYAMNLKEVKEIRNRALTKKGTVIEVYTAVHNYREGWYC